MYEAVPCGFVCHVLVWRQAVSLVENLQIVVLSLNCAIPVV